MVWLGSFKFSWNLKTKDYNFHEDTKYKFWRTNGCMAVLWWCMTVHCPEHQNSDLQWSCAPCPTQSTPKSWDSKVFNVVHHLGMAMCSCGEEKDAWTRLLLVLGEAWCYIYHFLIIFLIFLQADFRAYSARGLHLFKIYKGYMEFIEKTNSSIIST